MIMIIIQGSKSTFKKSGAKFEKINLYMFVHFEYHKYNPLLKKVEKKFEKRKPYIFFHFEYHKYNILLL